MKKLAAYKVYLIFSAVSWVQLLMVSSLVHVYYVQTVGMTPLELGVAGTIMAAATFLFEVPSGVVADAISRRLSVITGVFLTGAAYVLQGSLPIFAAIAIGQAFAGLGQTFISGAATAWIADEVGEARVSSVLLRGAQFRQIGGAIGTVSGIALGSLSLNLPIFVAGVLYLALGVFLVLFMPEGGFKPAPDANRTTWQTMRRTLRDGASLVRADALLPAMLIVGGLYGFALEGIDRLWEAHMLRHFEFPSLGGLNSIAWFGVFSLSAMSLSTVSVSIAVRRLKSIDSRRAVRALSALYALFALAAVMQGLAGNFAVALVAFWLIVIATSVAPPLYEIWINQNLKPEVRATVLSISSQVAALGGMIGGVMLGALATAATTRASMIAIGFSIAPALMLLALAARRNARRLASPEVGAA